MKPSTAELSSTPAPGVPDPLNGSADNYPLRPRAWAAVAGVALCALAAVFALSAAKDQLDILDSIRGDGRVSLAEAEESDQRVERTAQVQFGLSLLAGIAWLMWQSLAYRIERSIGLRETRFAPRDAVLWWFIPIAALFMPKRVMDDIWRGSDPGLRGDEPGFAARAVDPLMHIWWLAWVAGIAGNRLAAYAYDDAETFGAAEIAIRAYMASEIALMLAGALAIIVVLRITERVEARGLRFSGGGATSASRSSFAGRAYGGATAESHPTSVPPPSAPYG